MSDRLADGVPPLAAMAARYLGWTPAIFWAATPPELAMSLGGPETVRPSGMDRRDLARLMEDDPHG